MVSIAHAGLRGAQFVFNIIIISLVGNAIAIQRFGNSSVNYALFTSVFTWLVIFFGLAASFVEALAIPVAILVADGLAILFNFIAGVVLAAKLHVHSCGNRSYLDSNSLTQGSSKRCHELQAATAFFWFLFATLIASAALGALGGGSSFSRGKGGVRKGGPAMSSV